MADAPDKPSPRSSMGPDVNYLRPDILETTNRILEDISNIIDSESAPNGSGGHSIAIAGFFFNKNCRTFHSHLVWGVEPWTKGDREKISEYAAHPLRENERLSGLLYSTLKDRNRLGEDERGRLALVTADLVDRKNKFLPTMIQPWLWNESRRNIAQSNAGARTYFQIPNPDDDRASERRAEWSKLEEEFYVRGLRQYLQVDDLTLISSLVIPVFDIWVAGRGYGGLWGVMVCSFSGNNAREAFLTGNQQNQLLDLLLEAERLAEAYFEAGLAKIAKEKIEPPYDWIELFVKRLHWIQDWDCVTVFDGDKALYCYRHHEPAKDGIEWKWKRCDPNQECANTGSGPVFRWSEIQAPSEGTHPVLNSHLIKELNASEEAQYKNIDIEFRFPQSAVVRFDEDGHKCHFKLAIVRQHIAALRVLLPIVRTRRAALRNAVSAIMGRNMSHNIGSHVLARYAPIARGDLAVTNRDRVDHRTDFLSYLQKRMDFIADMATSDKAHWSQGLLLREQVERLNYAKQLARFGDANDEHKPILLRFITGKESMHASVEFGAPVRDNNNGRSGEGFCPKPNGMNQLRFACPGGEVGVHALFVIFENIIRNSARHGAGGRSIVQIFVDAEVVDDTIKLTVIDPGTELTVEGPKSEASVLERIENALKTPFLESDGSLNPRYWGIREMQICAHYLRGLPLSDLESNAHAVLDPPVLKPCVHEANGLRCLAYEFYLHKARHVAIVRSSTAPALPILPEGIKEFRSGDVAEIHGYEFTILENGVEIPTSTRSLLSVRCVVLDTSAIEALLGKKDIHEILTELHAKFIDIYRQKDQRASHWRKAKIKAVHYLESQKNGIRTFDACTSEIAQRVSLIRTWLGNDRPDEPTLETLQGRRDAGTISTCDEHIGIAWLDHPADHHFGLDSDGLPYLPFFGGAALPCRPDRRRPQVARWIAAEPCWSDSPQTAILRGINQENGKLDAQQSCALAELICAAIPRVIVLDERMQSRRFDVVRAVSLYKYWPMSGVWAPLKQGDEAVKGADGCFIKNLATWRCDLDNPNFNDIRGFLCKPTPLEHQGGADFFVIHLTILERLNAERKKEQRYQDEKLNDTLTALVKETKAQNAVKVVVTGRGVPTQARYNNHGTHNEQNDDFIDARFIPISTILEYLVSRPSKLGLMRTLWSA